MTALGHPDAPDFVEPVTVDAGLCTSCSRTDDDPIHDPFAAGAGATASGHQFAPVATERTQHTEAV